MSFENFARFAHLLHRYSPISLQLKFYVVRVRKEVFGSISSRDVDMSGRSGLCVYMKAHSLCSRLEVKGRKSERSVVGDV